MENKFKPGDNVVLKATPFLRTMTIEKINEDGTYKCFWSKRIKHRTKGYIMEDNRQDYSETLLTEPQSRITYLR